MLKELHKFVVVKKTSYKDNLSFSYCNKKLIIRIPIIIQANTTKIIPNLINFLVLGSSEIKKSGFIISTSVSYVHHINIYGDKDNLCRGSTFSYEALPLQQEKQKVQPSQIQSSDIKNSFLIEVHGAVNHLWNNRAFQENRLSKLLYKLSRNILCPCPVCAFLLPSHHTVSSCCSISLPPYLKFPPLTQKEPALCPYHYRYFQLRLLGILPKLSKKMHNEFYESPDELDHHPSHHLHKNQLCNINIFGDGKPSDYSTIQEILLTELILRLTPLCQLKDPHTTNRHVNFALCLSIGNLSTNDFVPYQFLANISLGQGQPTQLQKKSRSIEFDYQALHTELFNLHKNIFGDKDNLYRPEKPTKICISFLEYNDILKLHKNTILLLLKGTSTNLHQIQVADIRMRSCQTLKKILSLLTNPSYLLDDSPKLFPLHLLIFLPLNKDKQQLKLHIGPEILLSKKRRSFVHQYSDIQLFERHPPKPLPIELPHTRFGKYTTQKKLLMSNIQLKSTRTMIVFFSSQHQHKNQLSNINIFGDERTSDYLSLSITNSNYIITMRTRIHCFLTNKTCSFIFFFNIIKTYSLFTIWTNSHLHIHLNGDILHQYIKIRFLGFSNAKANLRFHHLNNLGELNT